MKLINLCLLRCQKIFDHVGADGLAYDYIVNGKPALDWVVERQCVKSDKDSGIVNDANDWAIETMKNPRYPLELFQRVITGESGDDEDSAEFAGVGYLKMRNRQTQGAEHVEYESQPTTP